MYLKTAVHRTVACFAVLSAAVFADTPARAAQFHSERHAVGYRVKAVVSLSAYTDAHAVALGASGTIAGDALLDGASRCLLASAGGLLDISPAGWSSCRVNAMSSNGTVAGSVADGAKSQGFVYRAGRAYVIPAAASFTSVNAAGLAIALRGDGSRAVYDAQSGTWPVFADAGRGCSIVKPIALNERFVFGAATCRDGAASYGLADAGHYASLTLPPDLVPSSILTAADQLLLYDPRSGGHAYLWPVFGARPPLDLGDARGYQYGSYTPIAANARGAVVGENYPQFFSWVHTPIDGTRELDSLVVPRTYFGLSVADVDESGHVLAQAFDFNTGAQVWLVLQAV